jgi:glycosyltransferase involved in cell wall biosynthesis
MKVHRWIDKYNSKVSFEITRKYAVGIAAGKSRFYSFHFSFWDKYIVRLLLIFSSLITCQPGTCRELLKVLLSKDSIFYSPQEHSFLYIRLVELAAGLFGYRYHMPKDIFPLLKTDAILKNEIAFSAHAKPVVSIIIPVKNQLEYTYNCLRSLQKNVLDIYPFEIIIIDENSADSTSDFFKQHTKGILYIQNDESKASLQSFELGLSYAKGEFICLLNQDVQVCENWMKTLVETIRNEDIGCASGKIIYTSGLLKEAGCIMFSNASGIAYGQNKNPEHPYYGYQREIDYSTGCGAIFKRNDLDKIQLPDIRSNSVTSTIMDICFSLRHHLGKRIIYQPLSKLYDVKAYSLTKKQDLADFKVKWQHELILYPDSSETEAAARKYQKGKTILFIDDVIPATDQDSGSNRIFQLLKIVRSMDYHVIFVPNDAKRRGHYLDKMTAEGFEVLYAYPNRRGMLKILTATLPYIDVAWICKPHNNELFKFIFDINPQCRWIYDTIDLHYLRFQRQGELIQDQQILQLAQQTKKTELSLAREADITIAITAEEKVLLENEQVVNLVVIPNIHQSNVPVVNTPDFQHRSGLLFIGGYIHEPNIDAVKWLAGEIMPEIWKTHPDISLTLLGSNPTEEVLALSSDKILVPGYIEDVSPYFFSHKVFVAPLRYGAGMKGKLGQSLEYGLPIVSTAIGTEGMNLREGIDVMIADDTSTFADKIIELYESPELWNMIRNNSAEAIEQYSPQNVAQKLKYLFNLLNTIK